MDTFSEFITEKEIDIRVKWIVDNLNNFKPEKLYKSIIYSMNDTFISKMIVGFKLHFILDDYQKLFIDPKSEEIDLNENLENKDELNNIIMKFSTVINHHMDLAVTSNGDILNILPALKEMSNILKIKQYDNMPETLIRDGDIIYEMTFNQLLYCAAFNQNPFTGLPCDQKIIDDVSIKYKHRYDAMLSLKNNYQSGIPLKYVKSCNIFG